MRSLIELGRAILPDTVVSVYLLASSESDLNVISELWGQGAPERRSFIGLLPGILPIRDRS